MDILIVGAHGFIGSALLADLRKRGHRVNVLSRHPRGGELLWDPSQGKIDPLDGFDCVINLAGEPIVGRWTQQKKERLRTSRIVASALLVAALEKLKRPPALYIAASAVGYYGDRGAEQLTETSVPGEGFLAELVRQWEMVPQRLVVLGVRVVLLRLGIVLGREGGILAKLLPSFRWGLGATLGSGKQYMSWIALQDLMMVISFVLEREMAGPINCVAPGAVSQCTFAHALGRLLHKGIHLTLPTFLLRLCLGEGATPLLASARVLPVELREAGFRFLYPDLESALQAQLR